MRDRYKSDEAHVDHVTTGSPRARGLPRTKSFNINVWQVVAQREREMWDEFDVIKKRVGIADVT